jgi:predicted alpha/beta-fold hydrolase
MGALAGHCWTIAAAARSRAPADDERFVAVVPDAKWGSVCVSGRLHRHPSSDTLVVILPGIAGNADTGYLVPAAQAVERAGHSHLRLGMRGTDLSGEDIWHGGLTDDLKGALRHPRLATFKRVLLLGYSVGGHVALRAAVERIDARIAAVAAVSAPLDLELGTQAFDSPARRPYRRQINAALDRIYACTAARRPLLHAPGVVRNARSSRERDALTIIPRYGFRSAEDYYERASVGPLLGKLAIPGLYVSSNNDPVVVPSSLTASLASASRALTKRLVDAGGHVGFPAHTPLRLGTGGAGFEGQIVAWLEHQQ